MTTPAARRRTGRTPARPRDPAVGTSVELDIGAAGMGGVCIARLDGRVVFVRHTLPGERVRALITGGSVGAPLRADAVEILTAAPERVVPPCPHAGPGKCGGCDWQHASLPAQRAIKAGLIREQMRRLAGLELPVVVEAADETGLGWRTRVQFHASGGGQLGFYRHRSHDIEVVEACPIAAPAVEERGVERARWPGAAAVEVIASSTGDAAVVVTPGRGDVAVPDLAAPASVLQGRRTGPAEALLGRPGVREQALGREWRISGSGFWQVHPAAPALLSAAVLQALDPRPGEQALDLYCGVGLFCAAVAERVGTSGRVTGIESDVVAVDDARVNLADLPQVEVLAGRVEDVLLTSGMRSVDLVVLDPPRSGAGREVVEWITGLQPRRIAYVSCDPASLARDLSTAQSCGYRVEGVRGFDLFPMTQHVEALAILVPVE